jgi:uncharacterized sporulation protein YeaH/YhbH (DUF444 family)
MSIIDRRLNPGGKSLSNRQRFLRRARALVQRAVRDGSGERSISDLERGSEVSIPAEGIREPRFRHAATGGSRDHVLPGNKQFIEGDTIEREPGGARGSPSAGSGGNGEDEFRFVLSREEFLDFFLEDLELPDLTKRRLATSEAQGFRRAGYTSSGAPVNLALLRTMRHALARRIAMKRPKRRDLARLEEEIRLVEDQGGSGGRLDLLREELARLQQRTRRTPYVDPIDLRYRRLEPAPRPIAQAVMFCLMDVSGSMSEHMKDLAKRFYMLLYLFLTRQYQHVDLVFIRHTHEAKEVDEQTFFHSPETGGTMVSSALREMQRIIAERYSPQDWNIYTAQASDGDNSPNDNSACAALLSEAILPLCQYFAYLEVGAEENRAPAGFINHRTALWQAYEPLRDQGAIAMRRVTHRREIYPVFRELFRRGGLEKAVPS